MFQEYPKEIILSDGTGLTLRPLEAGDEALLLEMYSRFPPNDRWFLDGDVTDPQLITDWVRTRGSRETMTLVAELEGRLIAHALLSRKTYGAKGHIGKIRVSVDPAYRERHLGTWVLLDLINLAMSMKLRLLVMQFVEGKDRSVMAGLKRLEFSEEAVLRDYLRDQEGRLHNLVIMVKHLHQGWDENGTDSPPPG